MGGRGVFGREPHLALLGGGTEGRGPSSAFQLQPGSLDALQQVGGSMVLRATPVSPMQGA